MIDITQDGITHLNIYSQGKTELGRKLSNFSRFRFTCEDGTFESIEAYWHWLGLPDSPERESLRKMYGFQAKKVGGELRKQNDRVEVPDFERRIMAAIRLKMETLQEMLMTDIGRLPFEHYYVFGKKDGKHGKVVDVKNKYLWMIDGMDRIRWEIINGAAG